MRPFVLTVALVGVLLGAASCGEADDTGSPVPSTSTPDASAPVDPAPVDPAPVDPAPDDSAASTQDDVERIAIRLEQVFASSTYPDDLDGAIAVARKNDLTPTQGNVIGGYEYDSDAREFTLCVESSTGAYAVYDTEPMSGRAAGASGGCP